MSLTAEQMICRSRNSSLDVLKTTLTPPQQEVAAGVLDRLEHAVADGNSSRELFIGPRGAGKTHLLAYICKHLEDRYASDENLLVLSLSEDERSVSRFIDVLLACIRASGHSISTALRRINAVPHEETVYVARQILEDIIERKSVVICVESLSDILRHLGDEGLGELRGFLQNNPNVSLLACSVDPFLDHMEFDHPFYGFFKVHILEPLSREQTREYLVQLADLKGDEELAELLRQASSQARVNVIHDLTGGNHRLLAIFSSVLTVEGVYDLARPLMLVIERELMPYYQQQMNQLGPRQNAILRAIVDIAALSEQYGRAVDLHEIVEYTLLPSKLVSQLLRDLIQRALVRRIKVEGQSSYELSEPLLRLVLDLKAGREQVVPTAVLLLKSWYGSDALHSFAEDAFKVILPYCEAAFDLRASVQSSVEAHDLPSDVAAGLLCAVAQNDWDKIRVLVDKGLVSSPDNIALLDLKISIAMREERYAEACVLMDIMESMGPPLTNGMLLGLRVQRGICFDSLEKFDESVEEYDAALALAAELSVDDGSIVPIMERAANGHLQEGHYDRVEELIVRILKTDPSNQFAIRMGLLNAFVQKDGRVILERFKVAKEEGALPESLMTEIVPSIFLLSCNEGLAVEASFNSVDRSVDAVVGGMLSLLKEGVVYGRVGLSFLMPYRTALEELVGEHDALTSVLNLMDVVLSDAQGEKGALLRLPMEIRTLIQEQQDASLGEAD